MSGGRRPRLYHLRIRNGVVLPVVVHVCAPSEEWFDGDVKERVWKQLKQVIKLELPIAEEDKKLKTAGTRSHFEFTTAADDESVALTKNKGKGPEIEAGSGTAKDSSREQDGKPAAVRGTVEFWFKKTVPRYAVWQFADPPAAAATTTGSAGSAGEVLTIDSESSSEDDAVIDVAALRKQKREEKAAREAQKRKADEVASAAAAEVKSDDKGKRKGKGTKRKGRKGDSGGDPPAKRARRGSSAGGKGKAPAVQEIEDSSESDDGDVRPGEFVHNSTSSRTLVLRVRPRE